MAKKRKPEAVTRRLDEVDRTVYSTFRCGANSLSQIYTQAVAQRKVAFQAGERYALEKLYQLIVRHSDAGSTVTVADIVAYLQNETDGEDTLTPDSELVHQYSQSATQSTNGNMNNSASMIGSAEGDHIHQIGHCDQTKNPSFTTAFSSLVDSSGLPCYLLQGPSSDGCVAQGDGTRHPESNPQNQNGETGPLDLISSMDMHSDSPTR
ncbi:holocarboxylase synthetase [Musa troglodytarum]|uniref:Holocarboxylase synthetase n=1 Tax=Musa troglodytarum TaxID=320322 RepID=A0A9E7L246_9LILI|nr:holocarboxylase synthetase [Musa troglodytarum]